MGPNLREAIPRQYGPFLWAKQVDVDRIKIDQPPDSCIAEPSSTITGWIAIHGHEISDEFQFRVGPITLLHSVIRRRDVENSMPQHGIAGFQIRLDLIHYLPYIQNNVLVIKMMLLGYHPFRLKFTVKENVLARCISEVSVASLQPNLFATVVLATLVASPSTSAALKAFRWAYVVLLSTFAEVGDGKTVP